MGDSRVSTRLPGRRKENILSIDPGKTTGYALFKEGQVVEYGIVSKEDIWDVLWAWSNSNIFKELNAIIVENYRIRPAKWKQEWGSPLELQILGAVKVLGYAKNIHVEVQEPNVKEVGKGILGKSIPRNNKYNHAGDAIAHGIYYLTKN